jgi:hypothetical protein
MPCTTSTGPRMAVMGWENELDELAKVLEKK